MSNYLFTLTITPVQSFISQARKTKDLFAGSEILSNLTDFAIQQSELFLNNYELIFPDKETFSKPNKLILKISSLSLQQIEEFGCFLESLILTHFKSMAYKSFDNTFYGLTKPTKFNGQIESFLQIYWVAVELEDDYKKSYRKLEQNLGAVKNLRTFEQLAQISGKKCSVCGERNGLFYTYIEDKKKSRYIVPDALYIKNSNQIKGSETLCAVCFMKRFYKEDGYPSTAKIALLDWLKKLDKEEIKKYESYFIDFDEALYFKDNLSKEYLQKWEHFKNDSDLEKAKKFLEDIGTSEQKKYYALLHFDIDDMGKKLSGLKKDKQMELSKVLGEFSKKAKSIVNKSGRTVYAGGDDFLGFVNLEYLFDTIEEIQQAFSDEVKDYKVKNEEIFSSLTYSTSIVIAHYKTQLDKVLHYSRTTLEEAKQRFKITPKAFNTPKNAIVITYITKSNNLSTSYFYRDRFEIFSLLNVLLQDKNTPKLSSKFIFNIAQEFRKFDFDTSDIDSGEINLIIDMMNIELKRLLKRASSDFDININEKKKRLQKLHIGLSKYIYDNWNDTNKKFDFENYMMFFKVAEAMNGER